MKRRIYIDTSVVGGYFDDEFMEASILLFERFERGEIAIITSDLLETELSLAPKRVRELLLKYSEKLFEKVVMTDEILQLADAYIAAKVVGKTSLEDCRHIAIATVYKADVLASWNFKHIVNLDKIEGYNSVNLKLGYKMLEIRSPQELVKYE